MKYPDIRSVLQSEKLSAWIVVVVGLMALWLALIQKLQRAELQLPPLVLQWAVAVIFTLAAVGLMALIVKRQLLTWPLFFLLLFWGWTFFRDLINGDAVLGIILGAAIVIGTFFASTLTQRSISVAHLTFPLGFLLGGLIFTLLMPEAVVRADGTSGFLGTLPWGQYMGLAGHPNHLGPVMVMGILILLSQKKMNLLGGLLLLLFGVTLLASGSDGSMGALAIALVFVSIFHDRAFREKGQFRWRTSFALGIAAVVTVLSAILILRSGVGSFTTGRTTIWSNYIEPSVAAGVFGFGHFYDRASNPVFNDVTLTYVDPHSIWLSAQVTGGYIGSALHMAFWVSVLIAISRRPDSSEKTLAIGLTVFLLLYGSVESLLSTGFRVYYPIFGLLMAMLIPPSSSQRNLARQGAPVQPRVMRFGK